MRIGEENLIKANEGVETEKAVETGEPDVDTAELANRVLENQEETAKLNALGKKRDGVAYQETLKSIQPDRAPEGEKKSEAERQAQRMEVTQKALQMAIDNLQGRIDKKGLAGFFAGKGELKKDKGRLETLQSQNRDVLNLDMVFSGSGGGNLVNPRVIDQIRTMVKAELDPEDQEVFKGSEQVRAQVGHNLTNVSAG